MPFTNPVSSVELAPGATVGLTNGTTVGINGPVDTSGSTVGVDSIPAAAVRPSQTQSTTMGPAAGTVQILANSTGTTQYVLVAIQITGSASNAGALTVQTTGTDSHTLLNLRFAANTNINSTYDLFSFTTPVGAGVSITTNSNNTFGITLYYASIDSVNNAVPAVQIRTL